MSLKTTRSYILLTTLLRQAQQRSSLSSLSSSEYRLKLRGSHFTLAQGVSTACNFTQGVNTPELRLYSDSTALLKLEEKLLLLPEIPRQLPSQVTPISALNLNTSTTFPARPCELLCLHQTQLIAMNSSSETTLHLGSGLRLTSELASSPRNQSTGFASCPHPSKSTLYKHHSLQKLLLVNVVHFILHPPGLSSSTISALN
ncbi:hypothetical protein PRIC1_000135 [Phytophthora ramorum]|nr:hypothetical protein KRP22_13573 [Phytophthora ramorum]